MQESLETLSLDLSSHGDSKSRVWQSWADVKHHSAVYYITTYKTVIAKPPLWTGLMYSVYMYMLT